MNPLASASFPNLTRGHWLWAVALVVTVFIASGRGQVAAPNIIDFDKMAHFSVFGLMATLVARSMPAGKKRWWAIVIISFYGASDEIHQSFTPGRDVEVGDWIADTSGAVLAVCLYQLWPAYRALLERVLWSTKRLRVEKNDISGT